MLPPALMLEAYPEKYLDYMMREPKGSKYEQFNEGNEVVTYEITPEGRKEVARAPRWQEPQPDRTLTEVYDPDSPTGTRMLPRSEAAGQPGRPRGQTTVYDRDGNPIVTMGGAPKLMERGTRKDLEANLLAAREGIARLDAIGESFRPEYLTYPEQMGNLWTKFKEKAGGYLGDVSEDERRQLADYSAFRRDAYDNINRYIKEITGAQMSEAEANRLRKGVPDPERDSPTEFASKWASVQKSLRLAAARYVYALKNGLDPTRDVSLGEMPSIINRRGAEIEAAVRRENPGGSDSEIDAMVDFRLAQEFGLDV